MKITKFEHACVVVEEDGERLVIDPGQFATSLTNLENITAVVITHEHGDHFDPDKVKAIIDANPKVEIFSVASVVKNLAKPNATLATPNSSCEVGKFNLQFTGGKHAQIHSSFPIADNVGVCVNEVFYYAGDSFVTPVKTPVVLALPAGAPWMKSSEAMDYLAEVGPKMAFSTHDGFLNDAGQGLADSLFDAIASTNNIDYQALKTGESLTV